MDRTSWIVVIICLSLIVVWETNQEKHLAQLPHAGPAAALQGSAPAAPPTLSATNPALAPVLFHPPENLGNATSAVLANDFIRVTFTSFGGAIQQVELLKHKIDDSRHVILNEGQPEPILNLTGWDDDQSLIDYELAPGDPAHPGSVTFLHKQLDGIEVTRTYQLEGKYQIVLDQTVNNPGSNPVTLPPFRLNVGTAVPIYRHDNPASISSAWLVRDTNSFVAHKTTEFDQPGFLGFKWGTARSVIASEGALLEWVAVKDQFFATILTPSARLPIQKAETQRFDLSPFPDEARIPQGIKAYASFAGQTVGSHSSIMDRLDLYAGPKEYEQIKTLGEGQSAILEFGVFSWLVKVLLVSMNYVHRGIPSWGWHWNLNYGWVVILITLLIKLLLWPLQSAANRSMKAMQVLQPRIKELQARFKDDPQKMQAETMKLYKDYAVNPLGGCLPSLVQIPIFIAFYSMLQNAIELRHVSWLWVHDLSQPDTIFHLGIFDLNPLPLTMATTQWLLMRMTPTAQDNQQMKIMQFMPFVFLLMLYNFAAALPLYWTVSNLVTMAQTYRNLKKPLPQLERRKKARKNPFGKK